MGTLHATMNISLHACCHHSQVLADDEFHGRMSDLFGQASALLFGRKTYELLHSYWPRIGSTGAGSPAEVRLARILDEKPKYVVASHEPGPGWKASRTEADPEAIRALKDQVDGVLMLVASPTLARTLLEWSLIDEYHIAYSPIAAGHGPTFLAGLQRNVTATLIGTDALCSGVVIHRYGFRLEGAGT
jgi:dihydrofolate reductase